MREPFIPLPDVWAVILANVKGEYVVMQGITFHTLLAARDWAVNQ